MSKSLIGLFLAGIIVSSSHIPILAKNKIEIDNLSGANRFKTAVNISKYGWSGSSDNVIIVNSSSVADALAVGPLARIEDAPVLLSERDSINSQSMEEINRLKPERITLIGGDGSLSKSIELKLESQGYRVERIWGKNRNETSYMIANKIKDLYAETMTPVKGIMVVEGYKGLADAAGAGAIAAKLGYPLLMASKMEDLDKSIAKDKNIDRVYLVGGVASGLSGYFNKPELVFGSNRTMTNINLIKKFYPNGFSKAYLAKDGKNNPSELIDSVAIGGLAARESAPVILLNSSANVGSNSKALIGNNVARIVKISGSIDRQADQILENGDQTSSIGKNPVNQDTNKPQANRQEQNKSTSDRSKFEYWDEANKYSTDLLMTSDEIKSWNRENLNRASTLRDPLSVNNKTYAVMTRREIARLKPAYPGNVAFDSTANTALNPWETLFIESYSQNRKWAYVKSYNSYGWLPVDSFAIATRYQIRAYESMPFAIIKNRQYLNKGLRVDMGNRLPIDKNMVLIPIRKSDGSLATRKIAFDSGSMNKGYLPFTRANIIRQALKFQNEVYGWGGSKNAHDCSSFVQDVFKSMGVMLPRDTKDQEVVNFGKKTSMRGGSKLAKLARLKPGTSLYMKGHVMLYMGKDKNGKDYMIHQYAGHYEAGRYVRVYSAKITPVTIGLNRNSTYLGGLRTAIDWVR